MFCSSKTCLLGAAIVFAGAAYFLYIPPCDGLEEQWKVWSILVKFKILHYVSVLGEMVGWDSAGNIGKELFQYFMIDGKPPQVEGLKTEDYTFDGVPVRLYRPVTAKTPSPCVIYIHGGGWTVGSVDQYDYTVAEFAHKSGCVFISVEYRLAPKHPFPIPFDDSYKASLHLLKNTKKYGVDEKRIGIAGDSAGGNLAAAVSIKLTEIPDIPKLRFQWLIYPVLQAFTFQLPSYIAMEKAAPFLLQRVHMVVYLSNYMGITLTPDIMNSFLTDSHISKKLKQSKYARYLDPKQLSSKYREEVTQTTSDTVDEGLAKRVEDIILNPFFAPLMQSNLSRVPPALITTANFDVLRDEGLLYGERLKQDGVEVDVYNAPNSIHCYMLFHTWLLPKFEQFDVVTDIFVKYAQKHFQ